MHKLESKRGRGKQKHGSLFLCSLYLAMQPASKQGSSQRRCQGRDWRMDTRERFDNNFKVIRYRKSLTGGKDSCFLRDGPWRIPPRCSLSSPPPPPWLQNSGEVGDRSSPFLFLSLFLSSFFFSFRRPFPGSPPPRPQSGLQARLTRAPVSIPTLSPSLNDTLSVRVFRFLFRAAGVDLPEPDFL